MQATQKISNQGLWVILATSFIMLASASMIFTLLAQIQDEFDLPTYGLGIITGTYFLGSLVAQFWFSRYADRGYTRILLSAGVLSATISLLGFGFSEELWQFALFRFFGGIGEGCWQPGARASLVVGRIHESGKWMGYLTSSLLAGITLGPLIGTLIYSGSSLRVTFVVGGLLCLVALPFVVKISLPQTLSRRSSGSAPTNAIQETSNHNDAEANGTQTNEIVNLGEARAIHHNDAEANSEQRNTSIWVLMKRRESLLALLLAIAVFLPVGIYDALWARFLEDLGASTTFVGISFLLYGAPFMILATFGGRLADRFGAVRLSLIAIAVEIPIVAAYGQMTRPGVLVTLAVFEGIVAAVAFPAFQSAMVRACRDNEQALGQGLSGGGSFAIAGGMGITAAPLYSSLGAAWTFGIAALAILVIFLYSGILAYRLGEWKNKQLN